MNHHQLLCGRDVAGFTCLLRWEHPGRFHLDPSGQWWELGADGAPEEVNRDDLPIAETLDALAAERIGRNFAREAQRQRADRRARVPVALLVLGAIAAVLLAGVTAVDIITRLTAACAS